MEHPRHRIPEGITRGRTIRQLIQELQTFEDQDMEVRLSLDDGDTHRCISTTAKQDGYCVLMNSEDYYNTGWQDFMDKPASEI